MDFECGLFSDDDFGYGAYFRAKLTVMSSGREESLIDCDSTQTTSCLHWAVETRDLGAVLACLQAGMPVNSVDSTGMTPLMLAAQTNQPEAIDLLVSARADVNFCSRMFGSVLHIACCHGYLPVVIKLLDAGANINIKGPDGNTSLFLAALGGHLKVVQILLKAGASAQGCKGTGLTPLHAAVIKGHEAMVILLMRRHPDLVNKPDSKGNIPLHYAVKKRNLPIIRALLLSGSSKNLMNSAHECPVHIAVKIGHLPSLKLLVQMGCRTEVAKPDGSSPIHSLVSKYSNDYPADFRLVLETLLYGGCDINTRAFSTLETPLYRAISLSKPKVAEILLSYGANPNLSSPFDITALNLAFIKQMNNVFLMMLHCGIDWRREKWTKTFRFQNVTDSENLNSFLDIVNDWQFQPVSLLNQCRVAFRKHCGKNLMKSLSKRLDVPGSVKSFILMSDLRKKSAGNDNFNDYLWTVWSQVDDFDLGTFDTRKSDVPDLV